jgi:preprotein translocase subunit SecY
MANLNPKALSGIAELKQRLWFVFWGLVVFRIGAHIPVPGIDTARLAEIFSNNQGNLLGYANVFSGGALQRLSIFALGIMPYISASIIMQLFTVVSPKLEQLKKEGESGRRKIAQYTRYATLFLATFQAFGMSKFLASSGSAIHMGPVFYLTTMVTLVTGTMFIMWLGERITERGVGNGISLIIFAGIVSGLPAAIANTFESVRQGMLQPISIIMLLIVLLSVMAFVVFVERGQRRITVNYAKRQMGRKMYAAQQSHLPLKINMAGVIPPIFASSLILFPASFSQWVGKDSGILSSIGFALQPGQPAYILLFSAGIIFFCFFYTALVFNPKETADNLKKSGAFVPGIRPGDQTARYIDKVMTRLTFVGALYITSVSIMPEFLVLAWQVPFYFGGTSLLIVVVVIMDFIAQVQAHLMSQQYDSLLKKSGNKTPPGSGGGGFGLLG